MADNHHGIALKKVNADEDTAAAQEHGITTLRS